MTTNAKTKTTRDPSAEAAAKRGGDSTGTPDRGSAAAAPEERKGRIRAKRAGGKGKAAAKSLPPAITQPKAAMKKDRLISLLSTKAGADVAALSAALGWRAHTTRAALTRLRQAGFTLQAAKPAGGGATVYRIATGGGE
jgi:hypothetical protein